jgi:hypothetical protein
VLAFCSLAPHTQLSVAPNGQTIVAGFKWVPRTLPQRSPGSYLLQVPIALHDRPVFSQIRELAERPCGNKREKADITSRRWLRRPWLCQGLRFPFLRILEKISRVQADN